MIRPTTTPGLSPMQTFLRRSLIALCALLVGLALVSLIPSDQWFIRFLDFIREPVFYLALVLAVVSLLIGSRRWWLVGGFVLVAAIQLFRFWPYFALAPQQVAISNALGGDCFTAVSLNVRMKNEGFAEVAGFLDRSQPDILLLMEPDANWERELAPQLAKYSYRLSKPQDNAYGMIFASNLPVRKAQMVANTSANTPTLYATINLPSGATFEFVGLHPRPPIPGNDTGTRDANIARAGAKTPDNLADVLVMGDFNDVPWSRTTTAFREQGGWRDPRIGRGTFATFPAKYAFAGWPLDQVMVKNQMKVDSFEIMQNVGSDHLPVHVRACVRPIKDR